MRQVAKKGLITAVGAASVLASTAGYAYASSTAQGGTANSPGVGSGNSVQAPVDIPVNACGNTVDVVGLLNPASGNHCANVSGAHARSGHPGGGSGGSSASGSTHGSPGVASGNSVQAPVNVPVNACGNSVNVVGVGNPAFGNSCDNAAVPAPPPHTCDDSCSPPPPPNCDNTCPTGGETTPPGGTTRGGGGTEQPPSTSSSGGSTTTPTGSTGGSVTGVANTAPVAAQAPAAGGELAHTGADGLELLAPAGAALLLAGGVLYRRARASAR